MVRLLGLSVAVQLALAGMAIGQPATDRGAALAAFAEDLAALQAIFPDSPNAVAAMQSGMMEGIWQELIEHAHDLKQRWRDNPYIEVTGFTVTIGWPSVHVDFVFKEEAE